MNVSNEGGSHGKGASQDFDLNLAPIIDCFTVLITFMLVSASFLATGIFDAAAEAPGQATSDVKPPAVHLEVTLMDQSNIEVKLSGKEKFSHKLPSKDQDWNLTALQNELQQVQKKWPEVQSMTLTASNEIQYLHLIRVMEATKKIIPGVLFGGF
jgi:biopolymer transport protein ExbD